MPSMSVHHELEAHPDTRIPDPHQDVYAKNFLGFWMYLMTDSLIFLSLFCAYAVLHDNTFGGPTSQEIYKLSTVFAETMVLLFSSFTCGLGILAAVRSKKYQVIGWLISAFLLGGTFIVLEVHEFMGLAEQGYSWTKSAFLSSFFTLVGTHGLHVSSGLVWMFVMIIQVLFAGITVDTFRRLVLFSLFWHFLDLVWIFIFTFVYLAGIM